MSDIWFISGGELANTAGNAVAPPNNLYPVSILNSENVLMSDGNIYCIASYELLVDVIKIITDAGLNIAEVQVVCGDCNFCVILKTSSMYYCLFNNKLYDIGLCCNISNITSSDYSSVIAYIDNSLANNKLVIFDAKDNRSLDCDTNVNFIFNVGKCGYDGHQIIYQKKNATNCITMMTTNDYSIKKCLPIIIPYNIDCCNCIFFITCCQGLINHYIMIDSNNKLHDLELINYHNAHTLEIKFVTYDDYLITDIKSFNKAAHSVCIQTIDNTIILYDILKKTFTQITTNSVFSIKKNSTKRA
jgi:hypothetical protein